MVDITTRLGKGSPLTFNEVDDNFTNLKDAVETGGTDTSALTARVNNLEAADIVIDGRLDGHDSDIAALQIVDGAQNIRLDDLEAADVVSDGRLDAIEALDIVQDGRLDDVEGSAVYYRPTKSAADTLAASLPDGATVITDEDEAATPAGVQTRRSVLSGALTAIASFLKTSMIAWKHGGTGAVWRTLYARLMDLPVSAADFGVTGSGSVETTSVQAAINAASAIGGRTVLRMPPNKTIVVGSLVPKSGVVIDLNGSTLFLNNGTNTQILTDLGGGSYFGVINGVLDCNQSANNGLNNLGGVWLATWNHVVFKNLTIKNCARIGLNMLGVQNLDIENYKFIDSGVSGSGILAYALTIESWLGIASRYISINGFEVKNVYGYGIHFYNCTDFNASNLLFDTLNFGATSITITLTNAKRGNISNLECIDISGDAIEINESSNITMDNVDVTNAGRYSLLVGTYNAGNYNRRIKVSRFKSTNSGHATFAAKVSATINCEFDQFDLDKDFGAGLTFPLSVNNRIKNSNISANVSGEITAYGIFTLEDVRFTNWRIRFLDKRKAEMEVRTTLASAAVYDIAPASILPAVFSTQTQLAGTLSVITQNPDSSSQGSFQTAPFVINNLGTAANLGTVTSIANAVARPLTIAGDAVNKKLTLTNGQPILLIISINLYFHTIGSA